MDKNQTVGLSDETEERFVDVWTKRKRAPTRERKAYFEGELVDASEARRLIMQSHQSYYLPEFMSMFDIVIAILQPMGNASNAVQFHLMPFLSPRDTFNYDPFADTGTQYECLVSVHLQRRRRVMPGYKTRMENALIQYEDGLDHEREKELDEDPTLYESEMQYEVEEEGDDDNKREAGEDDVEEAERYD
jgi:hypothetical protein